MPLLTDPLLIIAAYVAFLTIIVAWLGYFLDGGFGAFLLSASTVLTSVLCVGVGYFWGWFATLGAVIFVGWVGSRIGGKTFFSEKGISLLRVLWFWCAGLGALIFYNGTWFGLVVLGFLPLFLLIGGLYFFSRYIIPISAPEERRQAFRSLLTFSLGTNFPYFIIRDWKKIGPKPKVDGNPYAKFFSGPGITLTSADHLVVTTTKLRKNRVKPPGLGFTEKYEKIENVVDLRPQLRAFPVKTETKDGIPVEVFTFWPVQTITNGRKPALKSSFPYSEEAVFKAVFRQSQGQNWTRDEDGKAVANLEKIDWDDFHMKVIAPPILKKVILDYKCDELCSPGDPRVAIKNEIRRRLEEELAAYGIRIVGGGISNLVPTSKIIQQRIENWKAAWKQKIAIEIGELEAAKAKYEPEVVRNKAKIAMTKKIADRFGEILADNNLSQQMIVLSFIEAIQEMLKQSPDVEDVSPEAWEMLAMQQRRLSE